MLFKKLEVEMTANQINYLLFILQLDKLLSVLVVSTSLVRSDLLCKSPRSVLLSVLVVPMTSPTPTSTSYSYYIHYSSYILVEMTKPDRTYHVQFSILKGCHNLE
jgi:hypothetical protein